MGTYLLIAARNLVQAWRRTLLLASALAFVTVLLILFQSFVQAATDNMQRTATTLAAGHVNVGGFFKETVSDMAPVVLDVAKIRQIVQENTPGLDTVIDRQRGFVKFISDEGSGFLGLNGVDPKEEKFLPSALKLAETNTYLRKGGGTDRPGDLSQLGAPNTVVMFASQAKRLKVRVGDSITLTTPTMKGQANSAQVTVVAICEDLGLMSSWATFVSKDLVRQLYQLREDATGVVMIYLKDSTKSEEVMGKLRDVFAKQGYSLMEYEANPFFFKLQNVMGEDWTGQKLDLTTWKDEVSFLVKTINGVQTVGFLLLFILMVLIGIGILNAMWISVRERTGEIGTLRAIGMGRGRTLMMFLVEAVLLGLAATTAGSILGMLLSVGLDALHVRVPWEAFRFIALSDTFAFTVVPGQVVASVVVFTFVSTLGALLPAYIASRLQPVRAMQAVT